MAAADRPNVIVFFTDQQRWDTTALGGNPLDLTPNLDRVAVQGTHLANCCTPQPVCGPARSCLQTGQYATTTGVFHNGLPLRPDAVTLAHCFRAGGYHTAYIGKWHLGGTGEAGPVPEERRGGYEYWLAANSLEWTSESYHTTVYDNGGQPVELPGYRADALTDAAIRYVAGHGDQPFFLFLSFLEPHQQNHQDDFPAPEGYRGRFAERWIPPDLAALGGSTHQHLGGYYGMVRRLDEAYGRLLDALRSLDLRRNTIVLFTSDHGCHFKTRNSEYKRSCHESSIHVPGVLTGPGFFGGGQVPQLVSLIDLPPTLLEACGLPVPASMQGRSLLPLLRGQRDGWPDDLLVQISESQVGRALRTGRWKYAVEADVNAREHMGADLYRETHLYDLEVDPYELTDLVGLASHRGVADILRERLIRRMVAAGEAEPRIEAAQARSGGRRRVSPEEARA